MTNKLILALANRTLDDVSLTCPGTFNPGVLPDHVNRVRTALGLDNHETTWFLHHLLVAVRALPWLYVLTGEDRCTYDLRLRSRAPDSCSPGTLVPVSGGLRTAWMPATLPSTFTRVLRRQNATQATFEGQTVRAAIGSDNVLHVAWPEDSGMACGISFNDPADWTTGGEVFITAEPVLYPWDAAADLGLTADGHKVLAETGILQFWYAATCPLARTAALATAVALSNKAVYGEP